MYFRSTLSINWQEITPNSIASMVNYPFGIYGIIQVIILS